MLKKLSASLLTLLLIFLPMVGRVAAAAPVNLIANPSMETAQADVTPAKPAGWLDSIWGVNAGVLSYENTGHTGSHSLRTALTAYTDGGAHWYFSDVTVTPGQTYTYSNWYQSDVETQIDAQVTAADNTITQHFVTNVPASAGAWAQVKAQFTAPANAKSITFYQELNKIGYVQIDDAALEAYTPVQFNRALVSVTFDDGWRDQYTAGLPLLDSYGFKATFYLLTGTFEYPDYMDTTMIQGLKTDGQEIAAHTVTHTSLPTLTIPQIDQELADSQATLRSFLGLDVARNFATPYGEYNATVITEIKKYYRSHRSTDVGFNTKDAFDIYNIKVQNILDTTTPAQVAAWVAQAQADKSWLVLVYHEVSSTLTGEEAQYSVTPANLNAELLAIQQSGVAVVTVDKALDEILAQYAKPGDVNGDNLIDESDLSTLLFNWGKTGVTRAQGDLSGDGVVDESDLSTLLFNWGK